MKVAIAVPTSNNKAYCFHQVLRTFRQFDCPPENLCFYFVLDEAHCDIPLGFIGEFCRRYPEFTVETLFCPVSFDTDGGDANQWKWRAQIAADMRQVAFERARQQEDVSHLFMAGCDMLFPCDTIERLLACNNPLATGVYNARLSLFPITMSYDRETKEWTSIPRRPGRYEVDWCGSDFLMIERRVFERIDYTGFNCEEYNAGEDAWICHRTFEEFGTKVMVDGDLWAEHVSHNGSVAYPVPFYADIFRLYCPRCEWSKPHVRPYRDEETVCGGCREPFPILPFWQDVDLILGSAVHKPSPTTFSI